MEAYQWWWEVNSEGFCDFDTWTMKVSGRSDESVRGTMTVTMRQR